MVKANASFIRMQAAPELVYGTQDSTATPVQYKVTSEDLHPVDDYRDSPEINSDGTSSAGALMKSNAEGPTSHLMRCAAYDEFIRSAIRSAAFPAASTLTITGTVTFSSVSNSINDSGGGLGSVTAGAIIEITAAGTAANKQVYVVVKQVNSNKLTLGGNFVTTDAVAADCTIVVWRGISNGTTLLPWTWERENIDLPNTFAAYVGSYVDRLRLSSRAGEFATLDIDWKCSKEILLADTGFAGVPSVPSANPPISASKGTLHIFEGGPCGQIATITSSTDASPCVVTTAVDHNLQTGDIVIIEQHLTNTTLNNTWNVRRISATTFALRNRVTLVEQDTTGLGGGTSGKITKVPQAICHAAFDMEINNNLREQLQLTSNCPTECAAGEIEVTGSVSYYKSDDRYARKVPDEARTSWTIIFKDTNGAQCGFHITDAELRAHSGDSASGGKNADLVPTLAWKALKGATNDTSQIRYAKP